VIAVIVRRLARSGLDGRRRVSDGLELHWVDKTLANPPVEPPVLVEGLIRAGELLVLGAPRGVGKSWWIYNLAVQLASGTGLFLGTLPVGRRARSLILQGELDPWASAWRWSRLAQGEFPSGIAEVFDPSVRLRVHEVRQTMATTNGSSRTETYFEGELDQRVEEAIAAHGFEVLVLDPWATFFAGNENSNDQAEAGLSQLRALALKYGTAIVIVHHLGKSNDVRDPEDLWRGASRLADWASTRVTMLPHYTLKGASEAGLSQKEARRYLDVHFLRRNEPTDDFHVVLDESGWLFRWIPTDDAAPPFTGGLSPEDVARACAAAGGSWDSVKSAARDLGVSGERARPALDRAVSGGVLVEGGDGRIRSFRLAPAFGGQDR
jgi:hypothetical protein